jgi:hypothetical protein
MCGLFSLHDDDRLLKCIFLVDLLVELTDDGNIGNVLRNMATEFGPL